MDFCFNYFVFLSFLDFFHFFSRFLVIFNKAFVCNMYEPYFILQRAANQPGVCGQLSRATQPAVTTHHPCGQLSRATQPAVITVTCVVDVTAFCTGLRIHVILSTDPDLNFHFKDLIPTLFLKLKLNEIDLNLY